MTPDSDDNRARAQAAATIIRGYSVHKAPATFEPLDPDDLRDVMADAMHLCRREGWDFEEILGDARMNYDCEIADEESPLSATGCRAEEAKR